MAAARHPPRHRGAHRQSGRPRWRSPSPHTGRWRWSPRTPARCTAGSTSAPPSPPRGSGRACRITASTWSSPARATARAVSPATRTGWIAAMRARGRLPVVVGGTGLYVRALAEGLFMEPPIDAARRRALDASTARLEPIDLVRWAGRLDPGFAGGGRQRAARAIEVALLTGHPLSHWQRTRAGAGRARAVVHRAHGAAPGAAGPHPAARGGDGAPRPDRGGRRGAVRRPRAACAGARRRRHPRSRGIPPRKALARNGGRGHQHQHPPVRQAAGNLVPPPAAGGTCSRSTPRGRRERARRRDRQAWEKR